MVTRNPGEEPPAPDAERRRRHESWQKAVAGVLAKARRVDASDLPADPETLLDATTYDGLTVHPLYGPLDHRPESPLPGTFPFTRGSDAERDVTVGWLVSARFGRLDTDPDAVNRAILDGLQNGVSSVWLDTSGIGAEAIAAALVGVYLELAPLTLASGPDTPAAAAALFAELDSRGTDADVRLGASPFTDSFAGIPGVNEEQTVALALTSAARTETVRAVTVDGTVFHEVGAADAQEIGLAAAAALDYLRVLTDAGLSAADALDQLEFRFAATDEQFETIAKFRAARRVWARVAEVVGEPDHGSAPAHAVTSAAMMSQRDPWVNMLRTTLAAFGAGVGGADAVTVLPFDVAIDGGAPDVSRNFAARIARNTSLLLLEEAHLGRVLDPAGGSWYVESLTADMAAAAWAVLQTVEAAGGYRAALADGSLRRDVEATRRRRAEDIAHRRTAVTGVNEYPDLQEKPLVAGSASSTVLGRPVARYAAQFEALRDRSDAVVAARGSRPVVLLAPLGTVAEHNGRTSFAANLLASGGIEALNPGPNADLSVVAQEVGSPIAVLCGTDKRYASEGPDAVAALRAAGATTVLLAGPSTAFPDAPDDRTPDGFLTATIDAVTELSELLDLLDDHRRDAPISEASQA